MAVPNVAEGRDSALIAEITGAAGANARVLDVHSDPVHDRTVLTLAGTGGDLVAAATSMARRCAAIDMTAYDGRHPALGGLDVCPFVPYEADLAAAVDTSRRAGAAISAMGTPVIYYGAASFAIPPRELPDIRRGGLARLIERAREGDYVEFGPIEIDPRRGVVCVGARGPLIAFNIWVRCSGAAADRMARKVRQSSGGTSGIRALPIQIERERHQISMNLIDPEVTGIDAAFEAVARLAAAEGADIEATEIVGLVRKRHLPDPTKKAARLLREPGRSIEAVMR